MPLADQPPELPELPALPLELPELPEPLELVPVCWPTLDGV